MEPNFPYWDSKRLVILHGGGVLNLFGSRPLSRISVWHSSSGPGENQWPHGRNFYEVILSTDYEIWGVKDALLVRSSWQWKTVLNSITTCDTHHSCVKAAYAKHRDHFQHLDQLTSHHYYDISLLSWDYLPWLIKVSNKQVTYADNPTLHNPLANNIWTHFSGPYWTWQ